MSALNAVLSTTADGRWHPSIGDPSLVGWITVLAYLAVAVLAGRKARGLRPRTQDGAAAADARLLSRFWWGMGLLLLALGVNKQLDLQTLFTQVLRDMAQAQGWYEQRRPYQVAFIICVGVVSVAGTALLAYAMRRLLHRVWLSVLGLGLLAGFVLIRAASMHQVDVLLKQGAVRLNWVLELGAIGVIAAGALRERPRDDARSADTRSRASAQLPESDGRT
jgi:hypothetical protein